MSSILPFITGSAGALVVLAVVAWAFYDGRIHSDREFSKLEKENEALKAALELERKAVDEQARTGTVTNQLIQALTALATGEQHERLQRPGLTAKDLGL
jgi:hypothetical protein